MCVCVCVCMDTHPPSPPSSPSSELIAREEGALPLDGAEQDRRPVEVRYLRALGITFINCFTEMCSGSEAGSYLRLIDLRITKL